jgi:hypothetical protein
LTLKKTAKREATLMAAREAADAIVQMARDYRVASGSREISIEVRDSGGRRLLTVAMALRVIREI